MLALSSVDESKTASAAGLFNFTRTLAGAFAISIGQTYWEHKSAQYHAEMGGTADRFHEVTGALKANGMPDDMALHVLDNMISSQATIIAINHTFQIAALLMVASAFLIWLVPQPRKTPKVSDEAAAH